MTLELDAAGPAELAIFDARGRRVRVLADGPLEAGSHAWRWDGRDEAGRAVPGGCYLARVQGAGGGATGKLVLLR